MRHTTIMPTSFGHSAFIAAHTLANKVKVLVCLSIIVLSTGCQTLGDMRNQTQDDPTADYKTLAERSLTTTTDRPERVSESFASGLSSDQAPSTSRHSDAGQLSQMGTVPSLSEGAEIERVNPVFRPRLRGKTVDTFVKPLPIPDFIDVVFGGILEQPYITGPGVATMPDIVQLRSSGDIKADVFLNLITRALETYGVRVVPENGAFQIIEDKALRARIPRFIKSRARPSTQANLRPIVQFYEMQAVRAENMQAILRQAFEKQGDKLTILADGRNNFLTLSGLPEDVDAALIIVRELDELNYAGSQVRRYSPRFWEADQFAVELEKVMSVEGWQITKNPIISRTLTIIPVDYTNDIFIFTRSEDAYERLSDWIRELDRPISGGDTEEIFIYQVRNVDAQILADTANAVVSGDTNLSRGRELAQPNASNDRIASGTTSGRFTVDQLGNRIIIQSTANEYAKLASLLEALDTPAPEVLIEVQIAEVTLNDATNSGVEILIDDLGNNKVSSVAQTTGLGLGASGLNISLLSGNVNARLNALATNRKVKLLSTPVLVARSGGAAQIQVGTDVPIITSQAAADSQSGNGTLDVLQQVAYRKTGILLNIEPIVFSDYRIDLTISQEVSSTIDTSNSNISSPTISNRTLTTQLSLEDGQTAVMGGLIQENIVRDDKGIPFLKDIPALGQVFSNDSYSVDRTELVVLITAYVLRDQADKTGFVRSLSRSIDQHLNDKSRMVTLNPIMGRDE